jgi:radical SAM/Cys-rich protein
MNRFEQTIRHHGHKGLGADGIRILQANLGFLCNLKCRHCHVEASPERREVMSGEIVDQVLSALGQLPGVLLDLTGGAPELNPQFRRLVAAARDAGHPVQVRTNLAVLFEPGMEELPGFFRDHRVQLVASMPCYLEENVCAQRGTGVYQRAVEAIRTLNALGYGTGQGLTLDLVYNPGGPFLPPDQLSLEADYRRELDARFGLHFNRLLTIANMPIGRFLEDLEQDGRAEGYRALLDASFNPLTLDGLMCRQQLAVGWDGTLYDCDFNLALGIPVAYGAPDHISRFDPDPLATRRVVTGEHCFGCTAGCGSSCGGALVEEDLTCCAAVAGS